MGISISSVGSSVSIGPALDLPRTKAVSVQNRVAADQFAASLPGSKFKPQELKRTAADVQIVSNTLNHKLQFVVDQQTDEVIVKVINKETDKVVKVLPPEELQRLHRKLKETIGLLFNERV